MKHLLSGAALALLMTTAAQAETLSVGMGTWAGYGLIHLAEAKGFFGDVDVDIVITQDKPSAAAAISTGRLDGWATTVDTFIFYDAKKIGVKQVLAVDFSSGGEGVISKDDIQTVADLKGRTVGAEEGSSTFFFLLNVLGENGMTIKDVKLVPMKAGDAGAAFAAGRLDAAATWEPWLGRAVAHGGHKLTTSVDMPGLIVDTVAFRTEVIESRPADVEAFIKGYFEAYDYWTAHTEEANAVMAKSLGISDEEMAESLAGLEFVSRDQNADYIGGSAGIGKISAVTDNGVAFYHELGLVKETFPAADVVDAGPLATVLGE